MKSKLTRMKPQEMGNLKFKEAKMIVKKDFDNLQKAGDDGSSFFVMTEFDFDDKKGAPLLIVGELKGEWKKFAKEQIKPPHKNTAVGSCFMSEDGSTLTLNLERGKAKPKKVEKALTKGALKLVPSTVTKVIFNEKTVASEEEEGDLATDDKDIKKSKDDKLYPEVIAAIQEYKKIQAAETKERLDKIIEIDDLILEWEKSFLDQVGEDKQLAKKNEKLQDFRQQLYQQRIELQVAQREKIQSIEPIEKAWKAFLQSGELSEGIDLLADLEDRVTSLTDLEADIESWIENNPPPLAVKEEENRLRLEEIYTELQNRLGDYKLQIPEARKNHTKLMLEMLSEASDEKKKELANDPVFLLEAARTIPVAHINKVRDFLGLDPVEIEDEEQEMVEGGEEWNDPEIQKAFAQFEKVVTFSEDVNYRKNPEIESFVIEFAAGTQLQKESDKSKTTLGKNQLFVLHAESKKGYVKIKLKKEFYLAKKSDAISISRFEKTTADLFDGTPSKSDVLQGGLGDCYLLAAVTSVVAKDAQLIEDMMLDKGDSVTVRLFHVTVNEDGEKQFKARYFNIEKSTVKYGADTDQYAEEVLWVQILEKAYAAGNFTGSFSKYKGILEKSGKYKDIDGGNAAFAYEVLTGRPATTWKIETSTPKDFVVREIGNSERGNTDGPQRLGFSLPWGTDELNAFKAVADPEDYEELQSYGIFGEDIEKIKKWFQFVKKGSIDKLFKREFDGDYSGGVTIEDFELLFQGKMKDANEQEVTGLPTLDGSCTTEMIDFIKDYKLYPGARGSGVYSALQIDMFTKIKAALDNKELVSVGSKKEVGRETEEVGHSGGESVSGGLVGSHVYTVLKTQEKDPKKELLLRNPWGQKVQENIKVKDRIPEIQAVVKEVMVAEAKKMIKSIKDLQADIKATKKAYAEEGNEEKKAILKLNYKEDVEEYNELVTKFEKLKAGEDLENWKDKLIHYKDEYNNSLKALQQLQRMDPEELISKQVLTAKDSTGGGEFWMLLDDLSLRFDEVYIG